MISQLEKLKNNISSGIIISKKQTKGKGQYGRINGYR